MIGIFLGEQNSGKTLSMTYFAYKYYRNGYNIYSNYNLNFNHNSITQEILREYTETRKKFNKSIFLIDEIYLFLDSRNFGKKTNKIFSYFLLQTSKIDVHLFGTAQYFNTVERRFRDNANFQCYCMRTLKIKNEYREIKSRLRFIDNTDLLYIKMNFISKQMIDGFFPNLELKRYYLKAKPIFNLYDTTELLDIAE